MIGNSAKQQSMEYYKHRLQMKNGWILGMHLFKTIGLFILCKKDTGLVEMKAKREFLFV